MAFIAAALRLALDPDDTLNRAVYNHYLGRDFDRELPDGERSFFRSIRRPVCGISSARTAAMRAGSRFTPFRARSFPTASPFQGTCAGAAWPRQRSCCCLKP